MASIERTERGFSSDLTALVDCDEGWFFVKAARNHHGGRRESLIRERLINDYTSMVAPPLLWDVEDDEWLILGFEAVKARRAVVTPGSPDVPKVVDLVHRIGELPLPDVAKEWTETRWDRYTADPAEASLFRGDSLLHTDINPNNFLLGSRDWVVDWAWPTRGAGFIDLALLVVQLVAAGHGPAHAERWATQCPAWHRAQPGAVDAFAAANLRMHRSYAQRHPDAEWLKAMVDACQAWTDYRGIAVS
ncbi:protein kinase [Streptomyces sp. NPDC017095]|uniref:protein kinase n=1 Tax=Streptomyces sp. NPDC017095 TaxID=3364977 RepID=UPI0037BD7B5F